MHNFSVPGILKLWIDQIARKGKTFAYGANGPEGLLTGKKATILLATGGVYDAGTPYAAFVTRYFRERPAGAGATTPGEVGEPSSPA